MSGQMELCLELRPADFGTSNRGACSEDVVGLGWSDQAFQVFEDNLGDCSKIASLLPNEWVRPCVSVLVPQKWSLQVLKLGCRAQFLEVRAQRIHSGTASYVENLSTSS